MKKIMILLFVATVAMGANAQTYLSNIYVGTTIGKDDQGTSKKMIELKANGARDWFSWFVSREQPLKKSANPVDMEKFTTLSLGYGFHKNFGEDFHFHGGVGPAMGTTPMIGAIPKKSDIYLGGLAQGNISSESAGVDGELNISYLSKLAGSSNEWSKGFIQAELRGVKNFGKVFGVGISYQLRSVNTTERQIQGLQYMGTQITNNESQYGVFISVGSKTFKFQAGPVFVRDKQSFMQLGQYTPNWTASTLPTAWNLKLVFSFENTDE